MIPIRIIAFGVGIAGAIGFYILFASHQRQIGAEKAVSKIEKANKNATTIGTAAAKSSAAGVRGKRDPLTRDD